MIVKTPLFTYDDLAQLPDDGKRYELADGELIVSPAPATYHQRVSARFGNLLFRAEDAGWGRMFAAPTDVHFGRYQVVQPDLLFISNDRLEIIEPQYIAGGPDLVIEILSPRTRDHDLGWKKTLYARESVHFYWVADPIAKTVQPLTLGARGYDEAPPLRVGDTLVCPLFPDITADVAHLFP
jgi:Uma2 family endonuclease